MTIKGAAEKYGITVQAVYSRLKKEGIALESIKNAENGEVSADGEVVLNKLFDKETRAQRESFNSTIERLQGEVNRLEKENATLVEKVKALEISNDELKQEKERLLNLAEKAQELHKAALERLLPPPADNTNAEALSGSGAKVKRSGLFARLFGRG